jgi:hypothetical protein
LSWVFFVLQFQTMNTSTTNLFFFLLLFFVHFWSLIGNKICVKSVKCCGDKNTRKNWMTFQLETNDWFLQQIEIYWIVNNKRQGYECDINAVKDIFNSNKLQWFCSLWQKLFVQGGQKNSETKFWIYIRLHFISKE